MARSTDLFPQSLADVVLAPYRNVFTVEADFGLGKKTYPVFWVMEHLLYIVVKQDGTEKTKKSKIQRFVLKKAQCDLYAGMAKQAMEGKPVRFDILKARQIGFSTFIAGFFFVMAVFTPNFKAAVLADEKGHAKNIFRKYETFWQHLDDSNPYRAEIREFELRAEGKKAHPKSWKPARRYAKGQEYMEFSASGSILEVLVAGEGAGRSDTYDAVHASECAFFQGNLSSTINAISETVPDARGTFVFLETTANGFNEYKDIWDEDVKSDGEITQAFFMPWFENPEYKVDMAEGETLPPMEAWLTERQAQYGLSDGQMLWYWRKYLAKRRVKELTLQEFPWTPTDAFISTGECIFGSEAVARRKDEVIRMDPTVRRGRFVYSAKFSQDGRAIVLENARFTPLRGGELRIFEEPIEGHPYVGICDPNNEINDASAIQVLDNSTGRQVACFSSSEMMWDEVAYQFYLIGKMYNWALLSNEMNVGKSVMEYLIKLNYPKLYVDQSSAGEDYTMGLKRSYGHQVNLGNRPSMIADLKVAFREDPLMVSDYETLCEMESFQRVQHRTGKNIRIKEEAAHGKHDDLVMALAAFYRVRHQQEFFVAKPERHDGADMSFAALEAAVEAKRGVMRAERPATAFESATGIRF